MIMPNLNRPRKRNYEHRAKPDKRAHAIHATNRWKVASANYRKAMVWCEYSLVVDDQYVFADCVDHVVALNAGGDPYDVRNLMALCNEVHGRKSAMEGQGYVPDRKLIATGKYVPADRDQVLIDLQPRPPGEIGG